VPTLSSSFNVNSAASNTTTLTTSSFTPVAGDVIVVKGLMEDSARQLVTPTDTMGNTYTQRTVDATASHTWVSIWTAVAASTGSMTVSVGVSGAGAGWHSITVECWTAAALAITPALNSPDTGSGAPSSTVVTTQAASVVTWCCGDWAANSPGSRVYNSTSGIPVEDGLHNVSPGTYVAYYAWQPAASAGSQTIGLTTPGGQTWTLLGIEVLDTGGGGGGGSVDGNQFGTLAWQ
jgi:hypothetical protein